MDYFILDISRGRHHAAWGPLRLANFTEHRVFEALPPCEMYQDFIPVSGWVMFHCRHVSHFVYPLTVGMWDVSTSWLACKHLNVCVQAFVWVPVVSYSWFRTRCAVVGPCDDSVSHLPRSCWVFLWQLQGFPFPPVEQEGSSFCVSFFLVLCLTKLLTEVSGISFPSTLAIFLLTGPWAGHVICLSPSLHVCAIDKL